jgi:hypothetical protein
MCRFKTPKRKEVNAMKYDKPEVALLAPAIAAVESGDLPKPKPYIMFDVYGLPSDGAYEADE